MWLTCSSIGRKFVMALTGICLVLFVTFHCVMNAVALLWPGAYNSICQFLGANWYALVASIGLAALFILHIIYALWLTIQNRRARGNDRYAIAGAAPGVEWSSKNMLVLGVVVVAFLIVHLIQFWAKMQLQELCHHELVASEMVNNVPADPQFGTIFLEMAFSQWWTPVVYIIGFVALWFHMNHGFWSMFHTIGWNNNIWIARLKKVACWWTSIVVALFIAQAVVFTVQAKKNYYTTNETLLEQYAQSLGERLDAHAAPIVAEFQAAASGLYDQASVFNFVSEKGQYFIDKFASIVAVAETNPAYNAYENVQAAKNITRQIQQVMAQLPQPAAVPVEVDLDAEAETETTNE